MKKVFILPIVSMLAFSCVKKEEVVALQNQIIEMKKEIAKIKQNQNENTEKIEQLASNLDNLSKSVAKNSIEIEKLKTGYKPPKDLPLEGEEIVKTPRNPKDVYNKALDLYYEGKLEEAEEKFKEFLEKFKENQLYDNAMFWLGQIYYTKGDFKEAINQFENLIHLCNEGKLKDCNKEPIAMLKLAYSYLKIEDKENGKKYLNMLLEKYPKSEESQIAEKKLKELN